jgi:hypothetical protein
VGCSKQVKFEVPNENITILKNPYDCSGKDINYKPLIFSNDKEKEEIIKNLNSWKLVEDNDIQKESCILYSLTWENHSITIYGGIESISGVVIDKKSYDVVDGNMVFFDNYVFEELD